ncbi:MAG: mechanosensitive ion channel domain-containing protein [bacterium]
MHSPNRIRASLMKSKQNILAAILVVLVGAVIYGLYQTSRQRPVSSTAASAAAVAAADSATFDDSSLTAAQEIVRLPTTAEEAQFAHDALRMADQEMDLAFADAVRQAAAHPPTLTPKARTIAARLAEAQKSQLNDQTRLTQLTAALAAANVTRKDAIADQLALTKAQIELDQDEVDDARQDLIRAGGDPPGRMQAMIDEHEAASKRSDSTRVAITVPVESGGLIQRAQLWYALNGKKKLLRAARAAADTSATMFGKQHDTMEEGSTKPKNASQAPPVLPESTRTSPNHDSAAALVRSTERLVGEQRTRTALDQRADNQRQLGRVYARWGRVVNRQQRAVVNRALRGVLAILIIALIALFFDKWIERLVGRLRMERRRMQTLRTIVRVSLQVIGVLLILLVIFGLPSNFGTFLGLAGAGLTVALKDFIIGFLGWFMLMGRNGIRIGDLVEINGVTGEVVELGLFYTVLLETGDWTDSNHPTGRRVTFTNSYAIEGHYFNFSTSGQWLWDEIRVVVPAGRDPYPVVDAIRKEVEEATAETAPQAEQEWRGASRSPHLESIAGAPAVNIKPIIGGIEITVRYITRAPDRLELRSRVYARAIELLDEKRLPAPAAQG